MLCTSQKPVGELARDGRATEKKHHLKITTHTVSFAARPKLSLCTPPLRA